MYIDGNGGCKLVAANGCEWLRILQFLAAILAARRQRARHLRARRYPLVRGAASSLSSGSVRCPKKLEVMPCSSIIRCHVWYENVAM